MKQFHEGCRHKYGSMLLQGIHEVSCVKRYF